MSKRTDPDDAWDVGWEGHERAQLRRLATLPLTEKLRWLEQADALVRHLQQARRRSPAGASEQVRPVAANDDGGC